MKKCKSYEEEQELLTKKALGVLKEIYNEKGRNFTFKCHHLSDRAGISPHLLSRLMKNLPVRRRGKSGKRLVYETVF